LSPAHEVKTWFQAFAFKHLCRYTEASLKRNLLQEGALPRLADDILYVDPALRERDAKARELYRYQQELDAREEALERRRRRADLAGRCTLNQVDT
jgi:hypothetical protein